MFGLLTICCLVTLSQVQLTYGQPKIFLTRAMYYMERASTFFDSSINSVHEMVFSAIKEQNECYTFKEMLQQEDKADFIDAMIKEVQDHETRDH